VPDRAVKGTGIIAKCFGLGLKFGGPAQQIIALLL
jgi:hypothetical protein